MKEHDVTKRSNSSSILVADSGSTKTDWRLGGQPLETVGINPVRDSEEQVQDVISSLPDADIVEAFFYGAGCIPPFKGKVERALATKFPRAAVHVESDMLGAARALCGRERGIACILGTGSNSCLYDGEGIVANVPPLGYILGDEGSGAVLGRILVGDLLKGMLDASLKERFLSSLHLTQEEILDRVYRQPMPNRFLAGLVPFIIENKAEPSVHRLVVGEFRRFFSRNVAKYQRSDLSVHFVGGVAHSLCNELREAAAQEGFRVGTILRSPIDRLEAFHMTT